MPLSNDTQTTTASVTTTESSSALKAGIPVTKDAKTTSELFLPVNEKRRGASVFNSSKQVLYLDYSSDVSPAQHMVDVGPGQLWEEPYPTSSPIHGVWAAPISGEGPISGVAHVRSFVVK
jgi:hypothetical protein